MQDHGGALRKLRKYYEYTQQDLAKRLNVSAQAVSKWENGVNQIDVATMQDVCKCFGITLDDFVKIADGAVVSDVLHDKTPPPPATSAAPDAATAGGFTAVLRADKIPFIVAAALLAVIIAFVTVTAVVFAPRSLSADKIFNKVNPSVFHISVEAGSAKKGGTGFFIDDKGTAVTNYHVLSGGTSAEVTLYNGEKYKVDRVLGMDNIGDLAVFHVDVKKSKPVTLGNSDKLKTGDKVYAIGYPESFVLGVESSTLTDGIVSKPGYNIAGINYIQTNADFTHGNSGGVLVDSRGRVIGITTGKLDLEGVSYMNFALPANNISKLKREYDCSLKQFSDAHRELTLTLMDGKTVYWRGTVWAGQPVQIPAESREGYEFAGWFSDANLTRKVNPASGFQSNTTLYGKWIANSYTVRFASGGGAGTMTPLSLRYGERKNLPDCRFTYGSKVFIHWQCGDKTYPDGAEIYNLTPNDGETLTFTAVWGEKGTTLKFVPNGGQGTMKPQIIPKGGKITLPECGFTRKGYTFTGWAYGGKTYPVGSEVSDSSKTTVEYTASWKPITYTIEFYGSYGSGQSMPSITVKYDQSVVLPKSTFTYAGKPMKCWSTEYGYFADQATVKNLTDVDGETITFIASWISIRYTITLDPNGGKANGDTTRWFDPDDAYPLNDFGVERKGYTLVGWRYGGRLYRLGETLRDLPIDKTELTLVAEWKVKTYTVVYRDEPHDEVEERTVTDTFTFGDGYKLRNPFTRIGYTFEYWYSAGNRYAIGDAPLIPEYDDTISVWANWRIHGGPVQYLVDYDGVIETVSAFYGWTYGCNTRDFVGTFADFKPKTGYRVTEYTVLDKNGDPYMPDGQPYDPFDPCYAIDENGATMYVRVSTVMINYTLKINGQEITLRYDEEYTLPTPSPREGYVFKRWKIEDSSVSYSAKYYDAGAVVSKLTDRQGKRMDGSAEWTPITYQVAFDGNGSLDQMQPMTVTYDRSFNLPDCTMRKSGYSFLGWTRDGKAYGGRTELQNLTSEAGATVTFTALWGAKYAGNGTAENPYQIDTYEKLNNLHLFAMFPSNAAAHYVLTADIDCQGNTLRPIGVSSKSFDGVFDGNGHTISNAKFIETDAVLSSPIFTRYIGLFGAVSGGTIRNVGLDNYTIDETITVNTNYVIAPVAGNVANYKNYDTKEERTASISRVWASGSIRLQAGAAVTLGGFAGSLYGVIEDCYCTGNIAYTRTDTGNCIIGGFAAKAGDNTLVRRSYADMDITVENVTENAPIGGFICSFYSSMRDKWQLENVFVAGSITADAAKAFAVTAEKDSIAYVSVDYKIEIGGEPQEITLPAWAHKATTAELYSEALLKDELQWDTDTVWEIREDAFPILRGFTGVSA